MSNSQATAAVSLDERRQNVIISLVKFKEDDTTIIYSPALDLSGYGSNEAEARKSFSESYEEFIRYTKEHKTLENVLSELGWGITTTDKYRKVDPPKDSDLVLSNDLYNEIVNTKNYKVSREKIEFSY